MTLMAAPSPAASFQGGIGRLRWPSTTLAKLPVPSLRPSVKSADTSVNDEPKSGGSDSRGASSPPCFMIVTVAVSVSGRRTTCMNQMKPSHVLLFCL